MNEIIRIATEMKLGISICELHLCPCGKQVECRGIHGLSCHQSAARISRHNMVNNTFGEPYREPNSKILVAKEPPGLLRSDNKRPDGVQWKQGKCLAWDVTMPNTYVQSHLPTTPMNAGHAADKSAVSNTQKYQSILQTHLFTSTAIETAGYETAIKELGKRITTVTGEVRETSNLSGNSERQHAVFHGVIHYRHGLLFQPIG